jgi:parallel beta-helix repeat protein
VVRGNHVYNCSDDGIDYWSQSGNLIERNVVHHCGKDRGDGNGFKLGGEKKGGRNTVRYNVSYRNQMRGFVTNGGRDNLLHNNVAWGHDLHAGYENTDGLPNTYFNNVDSGAYGVAMDGARGSHNSWDLGIADCLFASTDPASPDFLHLSPRSPCIDAGVPVGDAPYLGAAPDLGPFEAR